MERSDNAMTKNRDSNFIPVSTNAMARVTLPASTNDMVKNRTDRIIPTKQQTVWEGPNLTDMADQEIALILGLEAGGVQHFENIKNVS